MITAEQATAIGRTTDLTAWTGIPVALTRTLNGQTATFRGVFTTLTHGCDNPREDFRTDDAGGRLVYDDGDGRGQQSTALCVPYGSTIRLDGDT